MKAEELLNQKIKGINIPQDVNELIHELQVHHIELEMQNEELMKNQIELQTANIKYFELYNFAPCGYFTLNPNGIIMDVNLAGTAILGIEKFNLTKSAFIKFVEHGSRYKFTKLIEKALGNEKILKCELELLKEKEPFPVIMEMNSNLYTSENSNSVLVTIVDISERKNAEELLKKSLHEKEILLREINHRVKNNLQIITSLLHLQENSADDEDAVDVLKESQGRVRSMAMVQEKLSQSPTVTHIKLKDYVEKLIYDILYSYGTLDTIKTNLIVEDLDLNIDTAITLGLIINELITNTAKYAFKNSKGTLTLDIKSRDEYLDVIIADDGIGIPKDIEFENSDSLGLQLVESLVNQLDGTMKLNIDNGTEYKISIKCER